MKSQVAFKPKIKNCPQCGRIYAETGNGLCRDCYDKLVKIEQEVLIYVREHPKCSAEEIIENTKATMAIIRRMVREGHFENSNIVVTYPCSRCGAPIFEGQYCMNCIEKMQKNIKRSMQVIDARMKLQQMDKGTYFTLNTKKDKK